MKRKSCPTIKVYNHRLAWKWPAIIDEHYQGSHIFCLANRFVSRNWSKTNLFEQQKRQQNKPSPGRFHRHFFLAILCYTVTVHNLPHLNWNMKLQEDHFWKRDWAPQKLLLLRLWFFDMQTDRRSENWNPSTLLRVLRSTIPLHKSEDTSLLTIVGPYWMTGSDND